MSQDEMARANSTISVTVGRYERNEVKPSIEVAAKIADALEVSLDFLVGKTNVEIDAKALKRLQDIQKLNEQDKSTVLEMVDAFLRDRITKHIMLIKTSATRLSG
jgi:transcriptional regulator with XRE-family HTH domain